MKDSFLHWVEILPDVIYELFLIALLFFLLALLVKGKKAFSDVLAALPNGTFNLSLMSFNAIIIPPVTSALAIYITSYEISPYLKCAWDKLPALAVIFSAIFIGDFIGYWRHRLEHSRFLWPSHSTHHSDDKMTWLTLHRFHPINRISTYIIDSFILVAMGFPTYAVIVNNLVRHYYGYFIHADLPWTYGKWGRIFVSPAMHRWHHAEERLSHNTNFATVFAVFDLAFGTYRVPGACNVTLGVPSFRTKSFVQQLLYPFRVTSYTKPKSSETKP